MTKWTKSKGFTLIELMIVVAIIAILAAIAIPNYLRFAMKSKTSEATTNLGAIRTCQEAYYAEEDTYYQCAASPDPGGDDSTADTWVAEVGDGGLVGFDVIGFEPDGQVRYQYEVLEGSATGSTLDAEGKISVSFSATAESDLDEDGEPAVYTVDSGAVTYPKAILLPKGEY